ncbi:MAG: N-acetylmuramoyl-L-alanine amidase [Porphyromonadaceae bacterium]|nr:N-acetylmuramoyl-L-alanine amidase [Porphyromonadaceae bacterium]
MSVWLWAVLFLVASPLVLRSAQSKFVVVIDAGHGGKDPGAMRSGLKEKDITLSVALKLGEMIKANHPKVKVLYTRDRDVFVGLQARADFANRHKASLFISIHVNSASPSARGTETYVMGLNKQANNLAVAMRENEVMLLEDDYKTTYRGFNPKSTESYIMFDLMQHAYINSSIEFANLVERQYSRLGKPSRGVRQAALWVLSQSAMPSVLTEIGFISNSGDQSYLKGAEGHREIARALSKAFSQYYKRQTSTTPASGEVDEDKEDSSADSTQSSESDRAAAEPEEPTGTHFSEPEQPSSRNTEGTTYRVQFMALSKAIDPKDKRFANLSKPIKRFKDGGRYLYTSGETKSLSQARKLRKEIAKHKQYKDCFVVEFRSGKRIGRVQ